MGELLVSGRVHVLSFFGIPDSKVYTFICHEAIDCILGGPHTQDIPKFEVPMRKDML